jgi:rhodanese-related sulfurtransferase
LELKVDQMIYIKTIKNLIIGLFFLILIFFSGCILKYENDSNLKAQILEDISIEEAYNLIENNTENQNFIILDIRTQEEYESGHIQNSIMIDYYSDIFKNELDKLDKNKTYLIYCRTGRRTGLTLDIMEELGFIEVYNMLGGITQWQAKGYPVV